MEKLNFEIPEDLKFIKRIPGIDWSILINRLVQSKLNRIARLKRIVDKSELTEKDVEKFSNKINTSLSQRYLE